MTERKAARRVALIDAAIGLLSEKGSTSITTKEVCQRAGLIERYLYESFDSRDDLVAAAFDSALERATQEMMTALLQLPASDPHARVRGVLAVGLDLGMAQEGLIRLVSRGLADPVLYRRAMRAQSTLESLVTAVIGAAFDRGGDSTEASFAGVAVTGAAVSVFIAWLDGRLDMTRDEVLDRGAALVAALSTN